jgi:hypothetical protein
MGMFSVINVHPKWLPKAPRWVNHETMQTKCLNVWNTYEIIEDGSLRCEGKRVFDEWTGSIEIIAANGRMSKFYEAVLLVHRGKVIVAEVKKGD